MLGFSRRHWDMHMQIGWRKERLFFLYYSPWIRRNTFQVRGFTTVSIKSNSEAQVIWMLFLSVVPLCGVKRKSAFRNWIKKQAKRSEVWVAFVRKLFIGKSRVVRCYERAIHWRSLANLRRWIFANDCLNHFFEVEEIVITCSGRHARLWAWFVPLGNKWHLSKYIIWAICLVERNS